MRRSTLLKITDGDEEIFKSRSKLRLLPLPELDEVAPGKFRDYDLEDAISLREGFSLTEGGLSVRDAQRVVFMVSRHEMEHWWPVIIDPSAPPIFLGAGIYIPETGAGAGRETMIQFLGPIGEHAKLTHVSGHGSLDELLPKLDRINLVNVTRIVADIRQRAADHGVNESVDDLYAVPADSFNEYYTADDRKARDALLGKVKRARR